MVAVPVPAKDGQQSSFGLTTVLLRDESRALTDLAVMLRGVIERLDETRALKCRITKMTQQPAAFALPGLGHHMPRPFFTIGHSTRSVDDFVALLNQ